MKNLIYIIIIFNVFCNYSKANDIWERYAPKNSFEPDSSFFLLFVGNIIQENNSMYFGSYNSGIDILNNNNWSRLDYKNTPLIIFEDNINDLAVKNGVVYAATQNGLLLVNKTDTILYNPSNSIIPNPGITHVAVDSISNVWLTSEKLKTLTKYDGYTFTNYDFPAGFPVHNYNSGIRLISDKKNNIWFTGIRSLMKFDGGKFKCWDSTNSPILSSERVDCFYFDNINEQLYICLSPYYSETFGRTRIFKVKNEIWEELNLENIPFGKDSIKIEFMTTDNQGNLIFGYKYQDSELDPKNSILILSVTGEWKEIIIPASELAGKDIVYYASLFVDNQDILWIGTVQDGVIKVNLQKIISVVDVDYLSLPNIWIRSVIPNPLSTHARLNFFCERNYINDISIKIYNYLGMEVLDITKNLTYNYTTATGIVEFNVGNTLPGLYYLNIRSKSESRTIPICIF